MQSQPRLADAARTHQREQAVALEQFGDVGDVLLAPDEAGALDRKIVGARIQRAQRGKLGLQRFNAELPDVFGLDEVL